MDFELADTDSTKQIWIFQKGNGLISVSPSPAVLKGGSSLKIVNKTPFEAAVHFPSGALSSPAAFNIPAGGAVTVTAAMSVSKVFEYDVTLAAGIDRSFYAEGGSKPSLIIER